MEEESVLSPPHVEHFNKLDFFATLHAQLDTQGTTLIATKIALVMQDGTIRDFSAVCLNMEEERDIPGTLQMALVMTECSADVKETTERETVRNTKRLFTPNASQVSKPLDAAFAGQLLLTAMLLASMAVLTCLAPRVLLLVLLLA